MTNAELHKLILAIDAKVDTVIAGMHKIELGIAHRGGKWAVAGKVGLFLGGAVSSVVAALVISSI